MTIRMLNCVLVLFPKTVHDVFLVQDVLLFHDFVIHHVEGALYTQADY